MRKTKVELEVELEKAKVVNEEVDEKIEDFMMRFDKRYDAKVEECKKIKQELDFLKRDQNSLEKNYAVLAGELKLSRELLKLPRKTDDEQFSAGRPFVRF